VGKRKITILNKEEQEGMRKVCRMGREVLDLAAAAAQPGVTTDHIDKVVHEACMERDVSALNLRIPLDPYLTVSPGLPITSQLLPLPEIRLHLSKRSHLPRHPRPPTFGRRRHPQHRHIRLSWRFPLRSERDLLHRP